MVSSDRLNYSSNLSDFFLFHCWSLILDRLITTYIILESYGSSEYYLLSSNHDVLFLSSAFCISAYEKYLNLSMHNHASLLRKIQECPLRLINSDYSPLRFQGLLLLAKNHTETTFVRHYFNRSNRNS